jgi:uncharacterized membrane protein
MADFLQLIFGTVYLRPYVFIFLTAYLVLAVWHLGAGRALAFLAAGYLIAWTAELSSIHTGFPFGEYIYIPATLDREIWVLGVPFMDSLSYVFLAYASYTLAQAALTPARRRGWRFYFDGDAAQDRPVSTIILAAVLMATLDVVIDPAALRGYRWFLGQIYGYPEPGVYFGIPLANFGGWFLVALLMISLLRFLATHPFTGPWWNRGRRTFANQGLLGPALYLGILSFNLAVTFLIGEPCLGWAGIFIFTPFLTLTTLNLLGRR